MGWQFLNGLMFFIFYRNSKAVDEGLNRDAEEGVLPIEHPMSAPSMRTAYDRPATYVSDVDLGQRGGTSDEPNHERHTGHRAAIPHIQTSLRNHPMVHFQETRRDYNTHDMDRTTTRPIDSEIIQQPIEDEQDRLGGIEEEEDENHDSIESEQVSDSRSSQESHSGSGSLRNTQSPPPLLSLQLPSPDFSWSWSNINLYDTDNRISTRGGM